MITNFKIFENDHRFIDGKYWIVKADDSYISVILKEYNLYDNYKDSFINNRHIKKVDKIIFAIGFDILYNTIIVTWDMLKPETISYWNNQHFIYSGDILNADDIVRFKNEVEFYNNVEKYNL